MVKGQGAIRATEVLHMNGRGKSYLLGGLIAALLGVACWFSFGGDGPASPGPLSDQVVQEKPDEAPAETNVNKERKPQRLPERRQVTRKTAEPRRQNQVIKEDRERSKQKRPKKKLVPPC
jgi:hypothetical protein